MFIYTRQVFYSYWILGGGGAVTRVWQALIRAWPIVTWDMQNMPTQNQGQGRIMSQSKVMGQFNSVLQLQLMRKYSHYIPTVKKKTKMCGQ